MLEALSTYMSQAALKLRKQNSVTGRILVFAHTSRFANEDKRCYVGYELTIPTPTSNTSELIKMGKWILKKIFIPGYRYVKVGVMLTDIRPASQVQQSFFDKNAEIRKKMAKVMKSFDQINERHGRDTVRFSSSGFERSFQMKQEFRSRDYTTKLKDVIRVFAK